MAIVTKVTLMLQPTGAPVTDAAPAITQHVYLDLTAGKMKYLKTDAKGTLVDPSTGKDVALDDIRTYQVVVSSTPLKTVPAPTQGTAAQVSGGTLAVAPHIAIQLLGGATPPPAGLACVLSVGGKDAKVNATATGWILSNDRSAGAVTLRSDTRLLLGQTAARPQATLSVSVAPAAGRTKPDRGDEVTFQILAPSGAIGFKVAEWAFDISDKIPGSAKALTATVVRPQTENPGVFDRSWTGILCASGTARVKFVVGITLRTAGDTPVAEAVNALDPAEQKLAVTVTPRTGPSWKSTLIENPEGELTNAITKTEDMALHDWLEQTDSVLYPAWIKTIATGPNNGCQFLTDCPRIKYTSTPKINVALKDPRSAFSLAQDKAYVRQPAPVRPLPPDPTGQAYTVGAAGAINIKDPAKFAALVGVKLPATFLLSNKCIDQPNLLRNARRHEYADKDKSHKANVLKALRALDPGVFAESLVQMPGATLDFAKMFDARKDAIKNVEAGADSHKVVDEAKTRTDGVVRYIAGQTILGANVDDSGKLMGEIWNPTTNAPLA